MKKIVWMLTSFFILITSTQAFSDVDSSYWANDIIRKWTNNGVMYGYADGSFKPNGYITKAELASIINNIDNDTINVRKRPSKDISISDWYCEDMLLALKKGIVELDGNGNLNPKEVLTREEALTMLAKLFSLKYQGNPNSVLSRFSDAGNIKSNNLPYVADLVNKGYVNGNNGRLNPKDKITRAEIVAVLDNMIEEICTNGRIANKKINGNLIVNGDDVELVNVQVNGYIYVLNGAKNGDLLFNDVYAAKGIVSKNNNVISYNSGTAKNNNLSNIEEERPNAKVQFVKITYSENDWTNESVTATINFDNKDMKVINNSGRNKYKFKENGEFTFICEDSYGNEYRYTAKVDNIAKKDLEIELDVKDNTSNAEVTVNVLENEAPIKEIYFILGSQSAKDTLDLGTKVVDNKFVITETGTYTVAVSDEAGNKVKKEFTWKNTAEYLINVIQTKGGTISPESLNVQHNGNETFTVTVDEVNGYYLADLLVDGVSQGAIDTYTFNNVKEEHTIEAVFRLHKYDITVIQVDNGIIRPDKAEIEFGGSQRFEIIPNEGYEVEDVLVDNVSVGTRTEYTFDNIQDKHTITAKFKLKTYVITVETNENGVVTYDGQGQMIANKKTTVSHGDTITFFIRPNAGCEIENVMVDNVSLGPQLAYTFSNIKSSSVLIAVFKEIPYAGAIDTVQIGDNIYATIYEDMSCIIYGLGDTYDYTVDTKPLGQYAEQIKNITVKLGIVKIGDGIFDNCKNVETITFPSSVTHFGAYAFANCQKLLEVVIPDTMDEIKDGTFYNCKSIERIIIPDSIRIIGNDAFNGCYTMETKTLSEKLEEIGDRAFKDCKGLIDTITVPEGTTKIGEEAFMGCSLLPNLEIPKTVEFIGKDAFDDCGTLKNITFKNRRTVSSLGDEWLPNGGDYRQASVGNHYVVTRTSFTITVEQTVNGAISPTTLNAKKAEDIEFVMTPIRGYEVDKLYIDGVELDGDDKYTFTSVSSTHIIGATFKPKEYTISYKLNGGAFAQSNRTKYTVLESFSLNNPTRNGYNFAGWIGTDLMAPSTNVQISDAIGDRSYEATWTTIEYPITYNLDGGTAINPSTYNIENEDITLNEPVKPGYKFQGWTNSGYNVPTKPVVIRKNSFGPREYTANWILENYAITYNLDGGEMANKTDTYNILSEKINVENPTKIGYNFVGWEGTGLITPTKNLVIEKGSTGNRTYTAKWAEKEYTITYNLNGGIIENGENPTTYTIVTPEITLKNPIKSGYEFEGWTGTDIITINTGVIITTGTYGDRSYVANWRPL